MAASITTPPDANAFTDEDYAVFTNGDCHVLALELHRLTGWPVWSFYAGQDEESDGSPDALLGISPDIHAVVQGPDGLFLDISGQHDADDLYGDWAIYEDADEELVLCRVPDLTVFQTDWSVQHATAESRARQIAPALLNAYYPHHTPGTVTEQPIS